MPLNVPNTVSVPAIACGKLFQVAERVLPLLSPEIEVIHFINSFEDAKTYIGDLLAGRGPGDCPPNHVGSHDYSKSVCCIFFGRAFTGEQVKEVHSMHHRKGVNGPVAWLAGDPAIVPPANPGSAYAEKAAENVKRALLGWVEAGADSEEIIWYQVHKR
ncbi:hypothetical protein F5Y16DRAFT_413354 [Xylariaceae sp. FL0255]|nr:hypothetical protein F5Y16DRAFT_413354 [Xylariaceae sp. FL0255]